jgi:hypothetical protein
LFSLFFVCYVDGHSLFNLFFIMLMDIVCSVCFFVMFMDIVSLLCLGLLFSFVMLIDIHFVFGYAYGYN